MRVLLADDQVWLRTALRLLLENEAKLIVVGETGSVTTLPTLVAELSPDLLFLDWQLSGFDCNSARLRTIRSLRARQPHLYIIALTYDDLGMSCLHFGANAQINRAESPDCIMGIIRLALSRKSSVVHSSPSDYRLH